MVADDVFRDQPVLLGARVRLEPLASRHFDGLWPMFGEPEGSRLTGTHVTFTEAQIRGWLATRRDHHDRADWAIVRVADGAVLGEAVINDLDAPNAAANFRIALVGPEVFGRGYGTEATRLDALHWEGAWHDAISMAILATAPRPATAVTGAPRPASW